MAITKTHYEPGNEQAWLSLRNALSDRIGGSELGTIAHNNPYCSYLRLFEERIGLRTPPDLSQKIPIRLGHILEQTVADMFTEKTGLKVHRENCIFTNDEYPHLKASIDRRIAGEDSGLECKTSFGFAMDKYKAGDFPQSYFDQCNCYLAVTGLSRWYLALLTGHSFRVFLVTRVKAEEERYAALKARYAYEAEPSTADPDRAEWDAKWSFLEAVYYVSPDNLAAAETISARFAAQVAQVKAYMEGRTFANDAERLAHLQNAVYQVLEPCDIDGSDSAREAIDALSPNAVPDSTVVYDSASPDCAELLALVNERKALNDEISQRDARVSEIENAIAYKMASTETAMLPGWKITYKNGTPRRSCSADSVESYFASQNLPLPPGLVKVGEAKRTLRIATARPKAKKEKAA